MTPTGSTYLALEISGLRQLLEERDDMIRAQQAEIARLKADVELMSVQAIKFRDMAGSQGALIVELVEEIKWLADKSRGYGPNRNLLERAEKATK